MWWVVGVVSAVVAVATYLTWTASRVDRLHHRAAAAQAALDGHLVRRAAAALTFGEEYGLPKLSHAARLALEVDARGGERAAVENDLTHQLRLCIADPAAPEAADLVAASRRVALTRQMHTDVVRDALTQRRRIPVRLFRLARRHNPPEYFDVDDPSLS